MRMLCRWVYPASPVARTRGCGCSGPIAKTSCSGGGPIAKATRGSHVHPGRRRDVEGPIARSHDFLRKLTQGRCPEVMWLDLSRQHRNRHDGGRFRLVLSLHVVEDDVGGFHLPTGTRGHHIVGPTPCHSSGCSQLPGVLYMMNFGPWIVNTAPLYH